LPDRQAFRTVVAAASAQDCARRSRHAPWRCCREYRPAPEHIHLQGRPRDGTPTPTPEPPTRRRLLARRVRASFVVLLSIADSRYYVGLTPNGLPGTLSRRAIAARASPTRKSGDVAQALRPRRSGPQPLTLCSSVGVAVSSRKQQCEERSERDPAVDAPHALPFLVGIDPARPRGPLASRPSRASPLHLATSFTRAEGRQTRAHATLAALTWRACLRAPQFVGAARS
jgi:hypothetical protein